MASDSSINQSAAEPDPGGDDNEIGDIKHVAVIFSNKTIIAVLKILRDRAARGGFITHLEDPDSIAQSGILQICDVSGNSSPLLCEIREAIARDPRPETIAGSLKPRIEELARRIIKQSKDAERHRLRHPHVPDTAEEVVTWTRRRTPYNEHVGDHAEAIVAPAMPEDSSLVAELHDILEGLTDRQRAVIHLAYWENYSAKEIAAATDLTPQAVNRIRKQAEAVLAARLRKQTRPLPAP